MSNKKEKWALGNRWVLRNDVQYLQPFKLFNVDSGRILDISQTLFYLLVIFCNKYVSFEELEEYLISKNINIDLDVFYRTVKKYSLLEQQKNSIRNTSRYFSSPNIISEVPLSSTPENAEIHLTHRCNLSCKHCFQESFPKSKLYKEISQNQWLSIFEQLEYYNVSNIILSGGEPMYYPAFNALFTKLIDLRFRFVILTNGLLITDENIKLLSRPNVSLTISLDGHTSDNHDFLRGKGTFDKVLKVLQNLKRRNAKITLSHTVHRKNYMHIEDFIKFAIKLEIQHLGFLMIDPLGRALCNNNLLLASKEMDTITENIKKLKLMYKDQLKIEYTDPMSLQVGENRSNTIFCSAGTNRIALDSNGILYPCVMAFGEEELKVGDLKTENLLDLWISNKDWNVFRGGIKINDLQECYNCHLKEKCSLKNCRLKSYKTNKNLYNKPIGCMLERNPV